MTTEAWPVLGAHVEWDNADPNFANLLFPTVDNDRTAVLRLDQPILAALVGDLTAIDDARAAASGYPRDNRPPGTSLATATATAGQRPTESPDPGVIPIKRARTHWDPANPFDASLVFEMGESIATLDLHLPVMTALLTDLETLNRKRAIRAGWTTADDTDDDSDDDSDDTGGEIVGRRSLIRRFLASHTAVQAGLNRLPLSGQAILAAAVIVIIVLFAAIFG